MANNIELTPTNDPDMSSVLKTLRHLSETNRMTSSSRRSAIIQSNGRINCPNCNQEVVVTRKGHARDEIIQNLNQLEMTLRSRGEHLPQWVQAYKNGDKILAAKLLHLGYVARHKETNSSNKRHVEVVSAVATSTMSEEQEESSTNANKRRRTSSSID